MQADVACSCQTHTCFLFNGPRELQTGVARHKLPPGCPKERLDLRPAALLVLSEMVGASNMSTYTAFALKSKRVQMITPEQ